MWHDRGETQWPGKQPRRIEQRERYYEAHDLILKVMDGFWQFVDTSGLDANPYRASFLQLVAVSETDARAEEEYYSHIRYFYD